MTQAVGVRQKLKEPFFFFCFIQLQGKMPVLSLWQEYRTSWVSWGRHKIREMTQRGTGNTKQMLCSYIWAQAYRKARQNLLVRIIHPFGWIMKHSPKAWTAISGNLLKVNWNDFSGVAPKLSSLESCSCKEKLRQWSLIRLRIKLWGHAKATFQSLTGFCQGQRAGISCAQLQNNRKWSWIEGRGALTGHKGGEKRHSRISKHRIRLLRDVVVMGSLWH